MRELRAQEAPDEVIIEAITTTTVGRYKEISGTWIDSWAKSALPGVKQKNEAPSRKFVFFNPFDGPTPGEASARYYPDFSKKGRYFVYVAWPDWGNAAPVRYTINHGTGKTLKQIKQDGFGFTGISNGNGWVLLGEYDFKANDEQYVEVAVDSKVKPVHPQKHGQVFADAVCFRKTAMTENLLDPALASIDGSSDAKSTAAGGNSTPAAVVAAAPSPTPKPQLASVEWLTDMQKAREKSQREKKPLLIFFDGSGVPLSDHYELKIFKDVDVAQSLSRFVLLRLGHRENLQLATQLQVFRPGVILIYDAAGNGMDKIAERLATEELIARLAAH